MKASQLVKAVLFSAVFIFTACTKQEAYDANVFYQYRNDSGMWEHLFAFSEPYVIPDAVPAALIVPHHDITVAQQNSIYSAVSQKIQPEVIVVIGPDHFEKGKKLITIPTDDIIFNSPSGTFKLDTEILHALAKDQFTKDLVGIQSDLWKNEHAIFAHTPFLKKYFPESRLVPIVLKPLTTEEEYLSLESLAKLLDRVLPDNALVIASVDFSHYQIPRMTALHDYVSRNTIQNKEDVRHIEVDSPESLSCIQHYSSLRGANLPLLIDMTSTYDFIPDEEVESTSHQYWAFYNQNPKEQIVAFNEEVKATSQRTGVSSYHSTQNQTILIAGSGNIQAGIRDFWTWDRYRSSDNKAEQILHDLAGKEARFLQGFDALIFDPIPGTLYEKEKHGTLLRIQCISSEDLKNLIPPNRSESPVINILVVTADNDNFLTMQDMMGFQSDYDVFVLRYNKKEKDTFAFVRGKGLFNLGTCIDLEGQSIQGQILCINWYDGQVATETFDYSSDSGIIPAIKQFPE